VTDAGTSSVYYQLFADRCGLTHGVHRSADASPPIDIKHREVPMRLNDFALKLLKTGLDNFPDVASSIRYRPNDRVEIAGCLDEVPHDDS
jgi:hypothetical protein